MKFSCDKYVLQQAAASAARAAAPKSPIAALEGLLLEAGADLRITGYDLKKAIYTNMEADIPEPGSVLVGARLFCEMLRRMPDGVVTVEAENGTVTVRCGRSSFNLVGMSAEDYPDLPSVEAENGVSLPQDLLKKMINECSFAVSTNESRPVYMGSLFELDGNRLTVVSVDGYRLAVRREPVDFSEDLSFVVPGKTLSELLKLIKDSEEPVEISAGRRHILFKIDNYTVISSLLEGEFLNYKAAIPPESQTEVVLKTREAIDSVERVSLLITDRLKSPIRCLFDNNEVKLNCTTSMGRASDQLDVEMTGQSVEIGFNNRYLLEALRNTECDEVKVQLGGPLSPMKVVPKKGDSFLFLVLPVRLKTEQ